MSVGVATTRRSRTTLLRFFLRFRLLLYLSFLIFKQSRYRDLRELMRFTWSRTVSLCTRFRARGKNPSDGRSPQ